MRKMRDGVPILGTITRKCKVEQENETCFRIVLTQGLNRQIRRMCSYLGYEVVKLKRIRVMNIKLGELQTGAYREALEEEQRELLRLLEKDSGREKKSIIEAESL